MKLQDEFMFFYSFEHPETRCRLRFFSSDDWSEVVCFCVGDANSRSPSLVNKIESPYFYSLKFMLDKRRSAIGLPALRNAQADEALKYRYLDLLERLTLALKKPIKILISESLLKIVKNLKYRRLLKREGCIQRYCFIEQLTTDFDPDHLRTDSFSYFEVGEGNKPVWRRLSESEMYSFVRFHRIEKSEIHTTKDEKSLRKVFDESQPKTLRVVRN